MLFDDYAVTQFFIHTSSLDLNAHAERCPVPYSWLSSSKCQWLRMYINTEDVK